jgi:hypothetical protein
VDSRDGPFNVKATTDLVIAYSEVQAQERWELYFELNIKDPVWNLDLE